MSSKLSDQFEPSLEYMRLFHTPSSKQNRPPPKAFLDCILLTVCFVTFEELEKEIAGENLGLVKGETQWVGNVLWRQVVESVFEDH